MANGIRIDELDATILPSRDHVVPAMKDGLTVKLTVGQMLDLLGKVLDPDEVGSKALFAALNLSDLDDPAQARANIAALSYESQSLDGSQKAQARENLGATEVGDALFTAASKAAARAAIDALGPSETADKAFRRGNILGTVSQSSGVPTGAIIERGSNANGEYVRFADGTQMCWHTIDMGSRIDFGSGILSDPYRTELYTWTYPAVFVSTPAVLATPSINSNAGAARAGSISVRDISASSASAIQHASFSSDSNDAPVRGILEAKGRWF